jgi:hypothetical protein
LCFQLVRTPGCYPTASIKQDRQTDGHDTVIFLCCRAALRLVSKLETRHNNNITITMVLHIDTSSARAPPASTPPTSLTHQEVACLKTALALVVVKRRLETRRRPSPLADQDNNDDDDDGYHNNSMEFELENNATSMTNQLCPWMPLLDSQLQTTAATAGATSSTSNAWMNHRSSSTGAQNGNGNNNNPTTDWVHIDHFMGLALQRAALTFEATQQQSSNSHRPHNNNHNDKGSLAALTTHLAHQLVRMHKNNVNRKSNSNNSSSTTADADAGVSDWIRSTFLYDTNSTNTQSQGKAQSSSLHLQTVCIVWHGMLTALPVELPVVLLPVLVPILQQALDESISPPSATTASNDSDHALYLQLFEHALHQAPTTTVETVLEELALIPAQYCSPVALADLAANYEWKRRRHSTANNSATNSHTTAGGALLLRYAMSSILQQTMLAHHHPYRTSSEKY